MSLVITIRTAVAAAAIVAVAGCSSSPTRDRAAVERPPELLSAGDFELSRDCAAVPGTVYRTDFVVTEAGVVERVAAAEGPACVQAALSQWVRTFRYAPGSTPARSAIDWMVTVARQ